MHTVFLRFNMEKNIKFSNILMLKLLYFGIIRLNKTYFKKCIATMSNQFILQRTPSHSKQWKINGKIKGRQEQKFTF
jgi:hypothetical protein